MKARAGALAAAAALFVCLVAARARADEPPTHRDADARFELRLPATWRTLPPRTGVPFAAATGDGAITLTISRIDHPNRDAWRGRERYFAAVERGATAALDDAVRKDRRVHRVGRVPTLDLELVGDSAGSRQRVIQRYLFFRRYTLALTITGDAPTVRRARRSLRRLRDSFVPYLPE